MDPHLPRGAQPAKTVGVIPARGGSKGVPRKNVRMLAGVPLIVHTIRAALASRWLDTIVVSTEDAEIAAIATEHGATVVARPQDLATDLVQNTSVVRHALEAMGAAYSHVALLQPTSPLRSAALLTSLASRLRAGQ